MIKTTYVICVGFLLLVPFSSSQATVFSGIYLYEVCKKDGQGGELVPGGHTACQGYIAGIIDMQKFLQSLDVDTAIPFCPPEDIQMQTMHDIVLEYLETHKQSDGFIAAPTVAMALAEVYPCELKNFRALN